MNENIEVVIFDLDNTLIDRQRAFKEMLFKQVSKTINDKSLIQQAVDEIVRWDDNGKIDRMIAFTNYCNKYNVLNTTPKQLCDYWASISGKEVYLFPDVIDILQYLQSKYRLAILTNGTPITQRRKLNSTNILDYFEYTLVSGEVGISKPDRRIFEYVANKLDVDITKCLYIGDNFEYDILGASNAGMKAIYINRHNKKAEDQRFIEILQLEELKKYL